MRLFLKRQILSYCPILFAVTGGLNQAVGEDVAWLTWRNGDSLKGSLNESFDHRISWLSPAFQGPINVRIDQLAGIRFPSTRSEGTDRQPSQFRIYLNNGDRLEGNLLSLNNSSITIDCLAFEEPVTLQRKVVRRIVHNGAEELRLSGPGELTSWTSTGRDRRPTDWFTELSGAFTTHQWSGNLFRPIELPEKVEISFSAKFPRGKPDLEIGLLKDPTLGPMLETWDNYVVLTFRTKFVPVMELKEGDKKLSFRLFWNQSNGEVRLCSESGELLAAIDNALVDRRPVDNNRKSQEDLSRGFSMLNRTPEMHLESLTIQQWDGDPAPVIDLKKPLLLLSGQQPSSQVENIQLREGSSHLSIGPKSVPLKEFRELIFPPSTESKTRTDVTRVAWYSGTTVSGDFRSVEKGYLNLQPVWSEKPLPLKLSNTKEIQFPQTRAPLEAAADHLTAENLSLFGTVRVLPRTVGNTLLGWQPAGASAPIPLAEDSAASMIRGANSAAPANIRSSIGQARLFLTNNELLSGELISIRDGKIDFTSRSTGRITISSDLIRAIDIGSAGRVLTGFGDPEWEVFEESEEQVDLTKQAATLTGGGFGNSSILLGDVLCFDAKWKQSTGSFTLRLFSESEALGSPSIDIVVAAQGSRLYIGKLRESGAFSFSGEHIEIEDNEASFTIVAEPKKVIVFANERSKPVLTIPLSPDQISGNGVYFNLGGGWPGWNQTPTEITFSNFLIERSPGSIPRKIIDSHSREMALTIPRIYRGKVPTHLLVAPNGDMLRGKLLSGVGNELRFDSKGEILTLPRNRVSTLVWLREDIDGKGTQSQEAHHFKITHRFVLMDGSRLNLSGQRVEGSDFIGLSEYLGECRVSIENVHHIEKGPTLLAENRSDAAALSYQNWNITYAPEPKLPGESDGSDSPLIGKEAPKIELRTLKDNETFNLAEHKGKVVVLDFWATWCGPCIKAMPTVKSVIEKIDSEDIVFIAINQAESHQIVVDFLAQRGWISTPVAFDFNGKVSASYEVKGLPHTIVIDRKGKISWTHSGFTDEMGGKLFKAIKKCL